MLRALTNEKYAIRLWGNIYNDGGLTVGRRFFWQHTVHPTQSTTNSCWQVDSVSTRLGLYQEEAWWDSASGWMNPERGVGSMGANGEPDGVYLPYVRGQFVGKGVGVGWLNTGAIEACMQQHWPW